MKNFDQSVTKELIEKATLARANKKSVSSVFSDMASKYGYAVGSVRNHYYKVVKNTEKGCELYKKLGLSDRLKPAFILEFTKSEERELLYLIAKGIASGNSVRKTLLEISNGNEKLALRYQNKFRNLVKQNSPFIKEVTDKVEKETGIKVTFQTYKKSVEQKLIESKINQMLDQILRGVTEKNRQLKFENEALEKENSLLRKVVRKTMQDKNFENFGAKC